MALMLNHKHLGRDHIQLFTGFGPYAHFLGTAAAAFIFKIMFDHDAGEVFRQRLAFWHLAGMGRYGNLCSR